MRPRSRTRDFMDANTAAAMLGLRHRLNFRALPTLRPLAGAVRRLEAEEGDERASRIYRKRAEELERLIAELDAEQDRAAEGWIAGQV